ncbi:alpha/beta hydrolase [Phytomonospora sp. NPDC050363]|uniref:alpha/beta fold hydrolase n=1 Tax=Phytomonospora sp. NPDC050363 TaxID=3155642 RepID=UPI0033EBE580
MHTFASYDGTEIAYRRSGDGPPLIVAPGGPARASEYLGDLGGLDRTRELIIFDNRGTGASQIPADPATYRIDHLVEDVEALREHLGFETIDLLGHSAGGGIGQLYAATHPKRLRKLVLATPSLAAGGLPSNLDDAVTIAERAGEPWHAEAVAAHQAVLAAETWDESERHRYGMAPLLYGRWDAVAQAHAAADPRQRSKEGTLGMYAGLEPDTAAIHAAFAELDAPVLVLAGEHDIWPTRFAAAEAAKLFKHGELAIIPGGGHYPWLDDAEAFTGAVESFLAA